MYHDTNLMRRRFWEMLTCTLLLCLAFLIIFTFRDYGLTWDEEAQMTYGDYVLNWYSSLFRDSQALSFRNLYLYGAFFEIVAQLVAKTSPFGVYETRHLVNAFFGLLGIYTAYRLGSYVYNSAAGFFAALFLALTPGLYGHLFNNSKDIPFSALFLLSLFFAIRSYDLLPRIPWSFIVKMGIAVGLTIGIRVGGIILLAYLAGLWFYGFLSRYFLNHDLTKRKLLLEFMALAGSFLAVAITAWGTMLLFWPWAQVSPVDNTMKALEATAHFKWDGSIFFGGQDIPAADLPWTYLPTWLAISLPEFYFVPLGVGCLLAYRFVSTMDRTPSQVGQLAKVGLLAFVFCSPIVTAIALHSTVYDGIRHFLFVLPPLAILAGISFASLLRSDAEVVIKYGSAAVIFIYTSITAVDLIQLHPYQAVYFNRTIAGGLLAASKRFETDYWGSSYKEGVQWVIQNYRLDASSKIRVANCSSPFQTGYFIEQDPDARQRFINVTPEQYPHVFLATTRNKCHEKAWGRVLHVVERQGVPLLYISEMRSPVMNREDVDFTSAESPLPDTAFNATIMLVNTIEKFSPGQKETLDVVLRNTSSSVWPALARYDDRLKVKLGNHWLDDRGKTLVEDDGRSVLPYDIKPGGEVHMKLTVTPPNKPGDYILEIDVVQESVSWFTQKGSTTLKMGVRVE